MGVRDKFSDPDNLQIVNAIRAAEYATSGEIRVHIEERCSIGPLDRAAYLFRKLEMDKTELRNGVLFYLAMKDRKFAIIGDSGINQSVPEGFWDDVYKLVTEYFRKGDIPGGLSEGIILAGNQLKAHFPLSADDKNELTDEVSYGED